MNHKRKKLILISAFLVNYSSLSLAVVCGLPTETTPVSSINGETGQPNQANLKYYRNLTGYHATYSTNSTLDFSAANDFFNPFLGTNQRSCGTCHAPQASWSINPALVQEQFLSTRGTAPLFRTNDGSVSPLANVSTETARCNAYKMLLKYANIRISLKLPAKSNFTLTNANISDPYQYASVERGLSLFRRPIPSANLSFLKDVMWDGRETVLNATANINLNTSLTNQANSAVLGHAQGIALTSTQRTNIVNFEKSLFTAQLKSTGAGDLNMGLAQGGPVNLANPAIAPTATATTAPKGFALYDAWQTLLGTTATVNAQKAIARGERVFRKGNLGLRPTSPATARHCTTCHQAQNVGSYVAQDVNAVDGDKFINVEISDPTYIGKLNPTLLSELPKYTLEFNLIAGKAIPEGSISTAKGATCAATSVRCKITTTDPGRALISGDYKDINHFRTPPLRSLAGRAPYFHNGAAKTLNAVVQHYVNIFGMAVIDSPTPSSNPNVLTKQEISDLVAFLNAL
jgi:cytochrome c peroxidase